MREKLRFLGMDVHAETIAAAIAEPDGEVRSLGTIPNRMESVRKLIKKLGPVDKLRVCYEAGPTGYVLYWQLAELGVQCEVIAPSLVPVKAGDRVKTDRRDAEKLARSYRSGDLTAVWVPDAGSEALRDLVRAREAAKAGATKDQMRLMMQSLLAERFKLAVHQETRRAPVFAMTLEKPGTPGPDLHPHPASDTCATTVFPDAAGVGADAEKNNAQKNSAGAKRSLTLPIPCGIIARLPPSAPGRHRIGGRSVTLAMVAESLPAQTGLATFPRPVIDGTGLGGTFDFTLEWTPPSVSDVAPGPNAQGEEPGPSIAQAMKQQLGLKLESTKGPVELLVIDHVDQPTAN